MTELDNSLRGKQKRYNTVSKNISHAIGSNIIAFTCLLLPVLMIGFIWTEFGELIFSTHMIADGVIMAMLLITGHTFALKLGKDGGKLDEEYIKAKNAYAQLIEDVHTVGTLLMNVFCEWQIDVEYEEAIHIRMADLKLTKKDWEFAKDMSLDELKKKYGKRRGKKLYKLQKLQHIELNEAILLYDGGGFGRGGVTPSAEESLHDRKYWTSLVLLTLFTSLVTISCVLTVTQDISLAKVVYTLFKLVLLMVHMARGYEKGAHSYNTVEVMHLKSKSVYLREYLFFIRNDIYHRLPEKYQAYDIFGDRDEVIEAVRGAGTESQTT